MATEFEELEPLQQDNISITVDTWKQSLKQVPNWKAPGPDLVLGFCLISCNNV